MPKINTITLEAKGEFPFVFYIEKAIPTEIDKELILEGIASTGNVDHDNERMSIGALKAMEEAINKDGVPLRVEHQKDQTAIIGRVFKAWVDGRDQLHIQARLDKSHPVSPILHEAMKSGTKMGLSVGGIVKRAVKEFVESVGGVVKTFYDVALNEVSVTPRPANYDSWLSVKYAKSIKDEDMDTLRNNEQLRKEFLLENSNLFDYLEVFAKSVPDDAWRKVDPQSINKEQITHMEKESKDEKDETSEKAISRSEFISLSKAVQELVKGFGKLTGFVAKAMGGDAQDQNNPDKKKPDDESATAKEMNTEPKKQVNPDQEKEKPEGPLAAKAAKDDEDDTTKATKKDDEDDTTKAAKKDDTYEMETVERAIKTLDRLTTRVKKAAKDDFTETETDKAAKDDDEDETSKASKEDEDDTTKAAKDDETVDETTTKNAHPLDIFIAKMTTFMEAVVSNMEKSGKRIPGFEKSFSEFMKNDKGIQETITELLKQPGFKKSVVRGSPYMVTKDGRQYQLTATPVAETVHKSQDGKMPNFKELYKADFSSVSQDSQE